MIKRCLYEEFLWDAIYYGRKWYYYRTNKDNQFVVAANREEASVFTLFDANQRIRGGKKATFYFTIPVEYEAGGSKVPTEKVDYAENACFRLRMQIIMLLKDTKPLKN